MDVTGAHRVLWLWSEWMHGRCFRTLGGLVATVCVAAVAWGQPGVPFDQIPGLGAMPDPRTQAFLQWVDDLIEYRASECRDVARPSYYLQYGAGGGGGDGLSAATAWTEDTVEGIQSRIVGLGDGPWVLLLRRGDMWRGQVGLRLDVPDAALGAYGVGAQPILTGFFPLTEASIATTSGWAVTNGVGEIGLIGFFNAVWVSRSAQDNREALNEAQYYERVDTEAEVLAGSGLFFIEDTTGRLVVGKLDEDEWNELETTLTNVGGILITGLADRVWVDGLHVSGWSMATESYCIRVSLSGQNRALVTGCYADVANRHVFGAANGGSAGGISTWIGNVAGACRTIGGATTYVGFAGEDGEFFFDQNSTIGYKLIEPNGSFVGSYLSHGSPALGKNRIAIVRSHVTLAGTSDYLPHLSDLPGASGDGELSDARGFIIDDWYDGGGINHAGRAAPFVNRSTVRINSYARLPSIGSSPNQIWMFLDNTNPSELNNGFLFNCTFDLDFSQMTRNTAFGILRHNNATGAPAVVAENCLFNVIMPSNPLSQHAFVGFSTFSAGHTNFSGGGWKLVNCIVQADVVFPLGMFVDVPSSAPGTGGWWGGQLSTAAANMNGPDGFLDGLRFGYTSAPGAVTLGGPVGVDDVFAPAEAWNAGTVTGLEYDRFGRPRNLLTPTIGPNIEGVACVADVTTQGAAAGHPAFGVPDGLVTGADISFFVNIWVLGDSRSDLTTQGAAQGDAGFGVPDGFVTGADLNFFVNAWISGCP